MSVNCWDIINWLEAKRNQNIWGGRWMMEGNERKRNRNCGIQREKQLSHRTVMLWQELTGRESYSLLLSFHHDVSYPILLLLAFFPHNFFENTAAGLISSLNTLITADAAGGLWESTTIHTCLILNACMFCLCTLPFLKLFAVLANNRQSPISAADLSK